MYHVFIELLLGSRKPRHRACSVAGPAQKSPFMPFMSWSLTFSYGFHLGATEERSTAATANVDSDACSVSTPSLGSASFDASEHLLSPVTRQLQTQVRQRLKADHERMADAESLMLLQIAEGVRQRIQRLQEKALDAESLGILLRATDRVENRGTMIWGAADGQTERLSSSWSSFEELGRETSPRAGSFSDHQGGGCGGEPGSRDEFESMLGKESKLRERKKLFQSGSQAGFKGRQSVAELMSQFELLQRSDRENAEAAQIALTSGFDVESGKGGSP